MSITTNLKGKLLSLHFASGKGDDRKAFAKINKDIIGVFIVDSGYVSEDLAITFFIETRGFCLQNRELI